MKRLLAAAFMSAASIAAVSASQTAQHQPYAGQQHRPISSLSEDDVAQIRAGHGWGLAKPAELNGYPGPAHVLELASELRLTADQKARVQAEFDRMQSAAKATGAELLAAELAIDSAFRAGGMSEASLQTLLDAAERARSRLRAVHLKAHLAVTPVLTPEQRTKYSELRGYAGAAQGSAKSPPHSHRGSH